MEARHQRKETKLVDRKRIMAHGITAMTNAWQKQNVDETLRRRQAKAALNNICSSHACLPANGARKSAAQLPYRQELLHKSVAVPPA